MVNLARTDRMRATEILKEKRGAEYYRTPQEREGQTFDFACARGDSNPCDHD